MSKIRWREKDESEINKLVRAFNRKAKRAAKKYGAEIQPEAINLRELKKALKEGDRNLYRKTKSKLSSYLVKGAEMPYTTKAGVNITLWQKREIDRAFKSINAKRRAAMRKYDPSIYRGTMHGIQDMNLQPRRNTVQEIQPKTFKKFVENLEKQYLTEDRARQAQYKDNYLSALKNVFGENSPLLEKVRAIPADKLVEMYFKSPFLQIDFVYDPLEAKQIENLISENLEKESQ